MQLDALKSAMRQMAEEKDAAVAHALAPLQEQLQVWQPVNPMLSRQFASLKNFCKCPQWHVSVQQGYR